jgi:hypothetical protein
MLQHFDFVSVISFFTYPQGNQRGKFVDNFISDPPRFITTDVPVHFATAAVTQLPRLYTVCPRRNVPDFGGMFLMLKYTDMTQNTYIQS